MRRDRASSTLESYSLSEDGKLGLEDDFVESLKGKKAKPVPDTLSSLVAYKEYCVKLLNKLRGESLSREEK